jgi:hypothetical protein
MLGEVIPTASPDFFFPAGVHVLAPVIASELLTTADRNMSRIIRMFIISVVERGLF